jgi:hypothetical protein
MFEEDERLGATRAGVPAQIIGEPMLHGERIVVRHDTRPVEGDAGSQTAVLSGSVTLRFRLSQGAIV